MEKMEIALWTISISLAVFGSLFAVLAFKYSSRTSGQIKELINISWITEESAKFFFDNLKQLAIENKKVLRMLKSDNITYIKYSTISMLTRMKPIAKKVKEGLAVTEYKDIAERYYETKKQLDDKFKQIFTDLEILSQDKKIAKKTKELLTSYHEDISRLTTMIVKSYSDLAIK